MFDRNGGIYFLLLFLQVDFGVTFYFLESRILGKYFTSTQKLSEFSVL